MLQKTAVNVTHTVPDETMEKLEEALSSLGNIAVDPRTLRSLRKTIKLLKTIKVNTGVDVNVDRAQLVYAKSILNDAIHALGEVALDLPREFSVEISGLREAVADLKEFLSEITITIKHEVHLPPATRNGIIILIAVTLAAAITYRALPSVVKGIGTVSKSLYRRVLSLYRGKISRNKLQKDLMRDLKKMSDGELKKLHEQVRKIRKSPALQKKLR